jgi:hypothetical protein
MAKRITHPAQLEKRKRTKKDLEYNDYFKESTANSNPKKYGESKKRHKKI